MTVRLLFGPKAPDVPEYKLSGLRNRRKEPESLLTIEKLSEVDHCILL